MKPEDYVQADYPVQQVFDRIVITAAIGIPCACSFVSEMVSTAVKLSCVTTYRRWEKSLVLELGHLMSVSAWQCRSTLRVAFRETGGRRSIIVICLLLLFSTLNDVGYIASFHSTRSEDSAWPCKDL